MVDVVHARLIRSEFQGKIEMFFGADLEYSQKLRDPIESSENFKTQRVTIAPEALHQRLSTPKMISRRQICRTTKFETSRISQS